MIEIIGGAIICALALISIRLGEIANALKERNKQTFGK